METTPQTPATLDALVARLVEMEAAHAARIDTLEAELAALRSGGGRRRRPLARFGRATAGPAARDDGISASRRTSRRGMLGTAAKVAVATAAAGVLAEQVETRSAFASGPGTFTSNVVGTPAVSAAGSSGADGVGASSDTGNGVTANSASGYGVYGTTSSSSSYGVYGSAGNGGIGVYGDTIGGAAAVQGLSDIGYGVQGTATTTGTGVGGISYGTLAIYGENLSNTANSVGVAGDSHDASHNPGPGVGVKGTTGSGFGVYGIASGSGGTGVVAQTIAGPYALYAENVSNTAGTAAIGGDARDLSHNPGAGIGVRGGSGTGYGVLGTATTGTGAYGYVTTTGTGVLGTSPSGTGVQGTAANGIGVQGTCQTNGTRVSGTATSGTGVMAHSASGTGLSASSGTGSAVVASSSGVGYGLYLTAPSGWAIGCVGRIRVLGSAVGTAILLSGTTIKTVATSACSGSSQVILTPTSDPQVRIWATVAPGVFTIRASSPPAADITFSYLLIN